MEGEGRGTREPSDAAPSETLPQRTTIRRSELGRELEVKLELRDGLVGMQGSMARDKFDIWRSRCRSSGISTRVVTGRERDVVLCRVYKVRIINGGVGRVLCVYKAKAKAKRRRGIKRPREKSRKIRGFPSAHE